MRTAVPGLRFWVPPNCVTHAGLARPPPADAERIARALREGQWTFHRKHRLLPGAGQLEAWHCAGEDLCRRGANWKGGPQDHRDLRIDDPAADRHGRRIGPLATNHRTLKW